jgi:hypothetical protein
MGFGPMIMETAYFSTTIQQYCTPCPAHGDGVLEYYNTSLPAPVMETVRTALLECYRTALPALLMETAYWSTTILQYCTPCPAHGDGVLQYYRQQYRIGREGSVPAGLPRRVEEV